MEPIVVRKAQQADIPAILEIEWECFREDSFSKEQFAYLISRSKGTFYVMMEEDRVIAYVSLLFHGGTRYLRIYSIAVHPDYRGRGLGQILVSPPKIWLANMASAVSCRMLTHLARNKKRERRLTPDDLKMRSSR